MTDALSRLAEALKGRYAIERELGHGGMATVYLADDPKHHRKVALKVLRPDLAATLGPERFLREVTIAANLQHPHILPVYDSGEAEGFLYYVMPHVEGESLRDRLTKQGELPVADAVRILRDVADAMAAAHAKGVVHRDIKPENIMLSGRHALVADFGVAKAVSEATGRQTLTTAGVALGTPTYMAPEQGAADPHTDHRADLYAFGVTAYEMLTGLPPFVGATPQAVLAAHVTEAPVNVTQRRTTVPIALAQLIMRCLEKKPADRPQSAEELLPVLEGLATPSGGITPTGSMPTGLATVRRAARVQRIVGAFGTLAVVAVGWWLLAGRAGTTAGKGSAPIAIAVLPFETRNTGEEAEAFSEGLAEDVATQLSKIEGVEVKAPAAARRLSIDTMSYGQIATILGAAYLVHGRWDRSGDEVRVTARLIVPKTEAQLWADDYQRPWSATGIFDLRSDVARQVVAALDLRLMPEEQARLTVLPTANTEAYKAYQLGRFFAAKRVDDNLPRAIAYFREAIAADSGFALAYAALADALWLSLGYTDAARDSTVPLVEEAAGRALAIDSTLGEAYVILALLKGRDLDARETAYRRAIALSPDYAAAHQRYGLHLVWRGRVAEGLAEVRRAHELDPITEPVHGNLIEALLAAGEVDEAIAEYDRLRALSPNILWVRSLLGWAYLTAGRSDEALRYFDEIPYPVGQVVVRARSGHRDAALELFREHEHDMWPVYKGAALMALGDTSQAFALWADVAQRRDPEDRASVLWDIAMRYEPFVGVWHDPRFRSVMNIMGFDVIDGMVVPLGGAQEP